MLKCVRFGKCRNILSLHLNNEFTSKWGMARIVYADEECDIARLVEREPIQAEKSMVNGKPGFYCKISYWSSTRDEEDQRSFLHFASTIFLSHLEEVCAAAEVPMEDLGKAMLASLPEDEAACYQESFTPGEYAKYFLQNVMGELMCNAAEHGNGYDPKKKIRVDLSLIVLDDRSRRFIVEVRDDGGYHDFEKHKEQDYVLCDLDADKRGHGELIVNKAGWHAGSVLNNRLKKPYHSSVIYCLEF